MKKVFRDLLSAPSGLSGPPLCAASDSALAAVLISFSLGQLPWSSFLSFPNQVIYLKGLFRSMLCSLLFPLEKVESEVGYISLGGWRDGAGIVEWLEDTGITEAE